MNTFSRLFRKVEVCKHGFLCKICCWEWTGSKSPQGYGMIAYEGRAHLTHRVLFFCMHGRWPDVYLLHHCDNKGCVNPHHHHEGDNSQNQQEAYDRNLKPQGENHWASKLTENQVRNIRMLYESRYANRVQLQKLYNVSQGTIRDVVLYRRWKHLK